MAQKTVNLKVVWYGTLARLRRKDREKRRKKKRKKKQKGKKNTLLSRLLDSATREETKDIKVIVSSPISSVEATLAKLFETSAAGFGLYQSGGRSGKEQWLDSRQVRVSLCMSSLYPSLMSSQSRCRGTFPWMARSSGKSGAASLS